MGRGRKLTKEEEIQIRERYPIEGSFSLASDLNRSRYSVMKMAERMGIKCSTWHKRGVETKDRRDSPSIRRDYFDEWSLSVAYDIGYIAADGNIEEKKGSLRLNCSYRDRSIILGIRDRLGSNHRVKDYEFFKKNGDVGRMTKISITGDWSKSLLKYGLRPNKSMVGMMFPDVPDCFLGHYVRGFMDGDGSIRFDRRGSGHLGVSLYCSDGDFLEDIELRIRSLLKISKRELTKNRKLWVLSWYMDSEVELLCRFLYPVEGYYPFLERKRRKFEEWARMKR